MEKLYNLLDVERNQLWNVRIVENGDAYGKDMCLTHDEADPLVEFYDADVSFNDGPKDHIKKFLMNPDKLQGLMNAHKKGDVKSLYKI